MRPVRHIPRIQIIKASSVEEVQGIIDLYKIKLVSCKKAVVRGVDVWHVNLPVIGAFNLFNDHIQKLYLPIINMVIADVYHARLLRSCGQDGMAWIRGRHAVWEAEMRAATFRRHDYYRNAARDAEREFQRRKKEWGDEFKKKWADAQNRSYKAYSAPSSRVQTYWDILGIARGADITQIKKAYRRRSLEVHPDVGGTAEEFRRVNEAYQALI